MISVIEIASLLLGVSFDVEISIHRTRNPASTPLLRILPRALPGLLLSFIAGGVLSGFIYVFVFQIFIENFSLHNIHRFTITFLICIATPIFMILLKNTLVTEWSIGNLRIFASSLQAIDEMTRLYSISSPK